MAAALKAEGVVKDTPVALFLPNTPWHPVFFFAILKAGGRVVHVSPLDAEREIVHKLKDFGRTAAGHDRSSRRSWSKAAARSSPPVSCRA